MPDTIRYTERMTNFIKRKTKPDFIKPLLLGLCFLAMLSSMTGCAYVSNKYKEFKGSLIGNQFTIDTFDNFGELIMTAQGSKISVTGNYINADEDSTGELSAVITISIDGDQIISAGDTMIFYEKGLEPEYSWTVSEINSSSNPLDVTDNTSIAGKLNAIKNVFGKDQVVLIQSQTGAPIYAFSGSSVYWEIPEDLPKFTRLNVDGKQLYIHRANFQIIDKSLLD